MKKSICIAVVAVTAIIDLLSFVLLFVYKEDTKLIQEQIFYFAFSSSQFDLVMISLLRFCILLGACIGLFYNDPMAMRRIKKSSQFIVYLACFVSIYVVLKIMYYTEDKGCTMKPAKVWTMIGLTLCFTVTTYLCWKVLASCKKTLSKIKKLNVNLTEDEIYVDSSNSNDTSDEESGNEESSEDKNINKLDKDAAVKFTTGQTVIKLLKMSKNDIIYIFLASLFLCSCSVGQVFLPYYTGQVVNYIIIEKSVEKFRTAMLHVALITLFSGFASGMRAGLFTFVFARYILRLQNSLFAHIMRMEIGFFDVRKTGEITSRLTSDCTKIGDNVGLNINVFLRNVVKVIGILFFMIKISWKLSVVTLVSIPVIAIISDIFGEKYRKLSEKVQDSLAYANESAEEAISSIRTVRSFAAEQSEIDRYALRLKRTYGLRKKEAILVCGYRWSTELTDLAMSLLVLYYGGHLVINKELTGGSLVSFILYSMEIGFCVEEIGDVYTGIMEAVGASKNVLVYIERKPLVSNDGSVATERIVGEIEFKNVSFAYPAREDIPVLRNLSFTAKQGEVVALVGPSGGGKSSIVNLLEHFYDPTQGEILIDNVSVKEYDHKLIHQKMSLVQQEPVLFARPISENITYGLHFESSEQDLTNSAIMANAHSFIVDLPRAYKTETGEKGIQLSGGQKQRIAIARALIRNPSILILDEATSALDAESEFLVQQAINKNLSGRTVIVIAHRLSTVEKADKIIVIEKGKVVQEGKHVDLINENGLYASLVKRQLLGLEQKMEELHPDAVDIPVHNKSLGSNCGSFSNSDIKI